MKTTLGDWLDGIMELSRSLQQMDIDASAYACLAALTLVNGKGGEGEGEREGGKLFRVGTESYLEGRGGLLVK